MNYYHRSGRKWPVIYLPGLLFGIFLLLSGCDFVHWTTNDEDILARVHNNYLYASDVNELIAPGTSPQDSFTIVSNYINNWIREQLLLHEAERALTQEKKDFSRQLEDYRNSLVIYGYESDYLRNQLDTVVTMPEIQDYYDQNRLNFELKENIVKVNYVQFEKDANELSRLRKLWSTDDISSKTELEMYCIQNGLKFSLFDDSWIYFNDLAKEVPIQAYNQESFLKYNQTVEIADSLYIYLITFLDYKIKESVVPLSMLENDIRSIIINRRKLSLLQQLRNDIYDRALNNNYFETY
jgi:hypothetical protein